MDKRYKHKLKSQTSKLDVNVNSNVKIELTNDTKVLPLGEINHVLDVGKQFDKERNESSTYRFVFSITPLFSNVLYNVQGNTNLGTFGNSNILEDGNGLITFNDVLFREDPYDNDFLGQLELSYEEAIDRHLKEVDGWFGFYDPDLTKVEQCTFYDLEPSRKRFNLNNNITKNWDILLTYPSSNDTNHNLVSGGLLIVEAELANVGGVDMVAFGTSTRHGLKNGDKVRLTNMPTPNYEGTFKVKRLGLDSGDLKGNYFVVEIDPTSVLLGGGFTNGRMTRMLNDEASQYYVRKFSKLTLTPNNYEIYPLGFSWNVFRDLNYQVSFNEDIDLGGIVDNLGRPLSEVYLTFIKTNSGNMFGHTRSGFDLDFLPGNLSEDVSNVRLLTYDAVQNQTAMETNITYNFNSDFYGDIVEYNRFELREKVLADVLHRFNTIDREQIYDGVADGPRREGYYYKPHHKIKIREFSLYIEQGDRHTAGIPDYAENLGDGRYLWRDLLDIGVYDGEGDLLDYPFTNGNHYIHKNLCFSTHRQDPFGAYGLYYNGIHTETDFSPADPLGDGVNDSFIVKNDGDEC